VAFSLIASLIVALTLLPALAARWGRAEVEPVEAPPRKQSWGEGSYFGTALKTLRWLALSPFILLGALWSTVRQLVAFWGQMAGGLLSTMFGPSLNAFDRWFERFAARYHQALEWSLDNRGSVVAMAGATLLGSVLMGMALDRDLLPDVDQGSFEVRMELEEGTSLPSTLEMADQVEATLLADPCVEAVFSRIGKDVRSYAESEESSGVNTALFQVRLKPRVATDDVLERVRGMEDRFDQGALTFEVGQATALGQILGGVDADIAVRVRGEDLDRTFPRAELVRDRLADVEEIGNVRVGTERGQPEIQVEILSEVAARYGIDPRTIAESLESAMRGVRHAGGPSHRIRGF
jgi:multidrug efflux pump subunit AcrB